MKLFRSPTALKNIKKRLPVWIAAILIMSATLYYRPDLWGVLAANAELIATLLIDEKIKEGYWFHLREASPQTHEACITETAICALIVLAAITHNPVIIIIIITIVIIATAG